MNTLVSWIDVDAVSGMARDMAAPDPAEPGNISASAAAWAGTGPAPVTRLVAEDFRLPENFEAAPFPAPGPAVPPEERSRVRNFLEEIRQKAEHSGLIPKPADDAMAASAAAAAAGSPRIAVPGAANLDLAALAGTTPPPLTSLPAPGALPPLAAPVTGPAGPPVVAPVPAAFKPLRSMPFSVPPGGAGGAGAGMPPVSQPAAGGFLPAAVGEATPVSLHLPPLGSAAPSPAAAGGAPLSSFNPPNLASGVTTAGTAHVPSAEPLGGLPPMRRHVPHFEVPLGPLSTRVRALTDWIRRQIDTSDIFILDTQGCPVGDREAVPEIVASAVVLAEAARHAAGFLPEAPVGALYLDLEDERRLCVITTATTHGNFTLGLILPDTLVPRAADRLRRALKRTIEADAPAPLRLPPRERW